MPKYGEQSQAIRDYLSVNPASNPKEIVAGLRAKGIHVKEGLANKIRYGKPKGSRRAVRGSSRRTGGKSRAVREYLGRNPDATPSEVVKGLGAEGVRVSLALVGLVKKGLNQGTASAGETVVVQKAVNSVAREASENGQSTADAFTGEQLLAAKRLVEQLGGMEKAKAALEVVEMLG